MTHLGQKTAVLIAFDRARLNPVDIDLDIVLKGIIKLSIKENKTKSTPLVKAILQRFKLYIKDING